MICKSVIYKEIMNHNTIILIMFMNTNINNDNKINNWKNILTEKTKANLKHFSFFGSFQRKSYLN